MRRLALIALVALAACGGGGGSDHSSPSPPKDSGWHITYSAGADLVSGNSFNIPLAPGHVNYVTFNHGSLTGKTRIVMRYRIDMASDVRILPKCCPDLQSVGPTIYFQVKNDDMQTDGNRWWATFASPPMEAGEHEIIAPLDANWTSVFTMSANANPQAFVDAKRNAESVGFTLGGGDGYGHGVYATGPATFTILDFEVE